MAEASASIELLDSSDTQGIDLGVQLNPGEAGEQSNLLSELSVPASHSADQRSQISMQFSTDSSFPGSRMSVVNPGWGE